MGVYRFEDLRVWQSAKLQCDQIGDLLRQPAFQQDRELASQMNSAAISVVNNISEGFMRRRDREFAQHLRYAAASNGELRACLHVAAGRDYIDEMHANELIEETNIVGRMLRRLQATLKE
jgi:four helix bundle protein